MTCYYPVTLYKSRLGRNKKTGKWPLVGIKDGYRDLPEKVPCSRCIGCRLDRSRSWAVRCVQESQLHRENCFITLTYRDADLIHGYNRPTLFPRHLQLFMKRFRKECGDGIKFFACGEYGERFNRPHYHACIFGYDFSDRVAYTVKNGVTLYTSAVLDRLWGHGFCAVGDVTFESAAYVARYIMGKKLGQAASYYSEEGIEPEFVRMSRGGRSGHGIGYDWFKRYKTDVFPHDFCVIRGGVKVKPPKYYSNMYELDNPVSMSIVRLRRKLASYRRASDSTRERLISRERIKLAQISSLSR